MMEFKVFSDYSVKVEINGTIYSEDVISKSLYWFANNYSIIDFSKTATGYSVIFELIDKSTDKINLEYLKHQLCRNLIDFKNREIVNNETRAIRELIIVKAFSPTDEFDGSNF